MKKLQLGYANYSSREEAIAYKQLKHSFQPNFGGLFFILISLELFRSKAFRPRKLTNYCSLLYHCQTLVLHDVCLLKKKMEIVRILLVLEVKDDSNLHSSISLFSQNLLQFYSINKKKYLFGKICFALALKLFLATTCGYYLVQLIFIHILIGFGKYFFMIRIFVNIKFMILITAIE